MKRNNEKLDLFVVSSPYQVLSAFEAREHFRSINNILIVSLPSDSDEMSSQQICEIVKRTGWRKVYYVYPQSENKIVGVIKRWRILVRFRFLKNLNCDRFFMGDFRVQWKHYLRNVAGPRKTILIDDGAATVNIFKDYLSKNIFYPEKKGVLKNRLEKLLYLPFLPTGRPESKLSVFTSYAIPENSSLDVISTDFSFLKKSFSISAKHIKKDQVWFVGSPYSEKKILSLELEIKFIGKCIKWLESKGLEVVYIAHRFDSVEKLDLIKNESSIEVRRLRLPLEAHVLLECEAPEFLSAIYSSVLETLPKIVDVRGVYCFKMPDEFLTKAVSEIYAHYECIWVNLTNFEVISNIEGALHG